MCNINFRRYKVFLFALTFLVTDLSALSIMDGNIGSGGTFGGVVIEPKEPGADDPPLQPLTFTIIGRSQNSMTVRWRDRSNFETENRLHRKSSGQGWQLIATFGSVDDWYSYTDSPLAPGFHCYRLQTSNASGDSPFSPEACAYSAGYFHTRLRVLTYNVFGKSDGNCSKRARLFGENVANAQPPYDIVALQEYYHTLDFDRYTCDHQHLSNAIWSIDSPTGRYRNSDNYYRFYPEGEFLDQEADGGIGIFALHPIQQFDEWEWFSSHWLKPAQQGFIFSKINIPNSPVTIDTYIVHVDSNSDDCNNDCRRAELQHLAYTISQRSRYSGNPVMVMGDFNIDGAETQNENSGYDDILEAFHLPRDLWRENHPVANGYTYDNCGIHPTTNCTTGERIDYIFVLDDTYFSNSHFNLNIVDPDDVKVIDWYWTTDYPEEFYDFPWVYPIERVSDHFGVEATLEVRERTWQTGTFEFCQMEKDAYENAIADLVHTDELIYDSPLYVPSDLVRSRSYYFQYVRAEYSAMVADTKSAWIECREKLIESAPLT